MIVAFVTLSIGLTLSVLYKRFNHPKPQPQSTTPCSMLSPAPPTQCVAIPYEDDDEYPDSSELTPWDIARFINDHPRANLARLWQRLHVKADQDFISDFSKCEGCIASVQDYDLDNEPGDETLLKLADGLAESFRYLVFKRQTNDKWRLLGHVDAWGKYKDSQSIVLASGGHSWLVIQGQSASGSGVALYENRVFSVSSNGLKEIASYECDGFQSGLDQWPTTEFTSRILSCELAGNQTKLTVEFTIEYWTWTSDDKRLPLFSKRQTAVFINSKNGKTVLDPNDSSITEHEMAHVYHIDSMTDFDFLQYNYSELLKLATRGNHPQKSWLKNYLKAYASDSVKKQTLAALAK
jgi:hypothetical protein